MGAALEEGQVVAGRYRIGKLLGRGGMGAVHEAWDERFHERVAFKVTIAAGPAAAEVEARFAREARLSNQLGREQPRIVRTRDWARLDEARLYLVMDLVDGARPLDLKGGDLAARVARVRQAAELVAAMHRGGVVHRDLKPANLLQSADGRVHLTDLGLAKVLGEAEATGAEHGLTQAGQGFGTPGFMPLEQYEDAARADARADVWALGCMLFAALSGVYPFPGAMTQVLARLVRIRGGQVPLPRPRDLDSTIPRALDALVTASLSIEPEGRPKDAGAFVEALDAALAVADGPAPRAGPAPGAGSGAPSPAPTGSGPPSLAPAGGAGESLAPPGSAGAGLARTGAAGPGLARTGAGGPVLAPAGSAGATPALTQGAEPTGELARAAEGAALAGSFGRSPGVERTPRAPEPAPAGAGPDATWRRLRRLALTLVFAAPTGALLGGAGGLLLTALAGPGVEAGEAKVTSGVAFVAVAALLVAPFTSFVELLGARRALRLAEAGAFLLALFLLFRDQDREVGVAVAITAGVLLPLLGLRGLVAWPLVSLASATAASGAVAVSMLVGDAWTASNLGAVPLTALAGAASAAALALADRIDARSDARRPLRGGLLGAAGHALGGLAFVAAALATGGFTRAPLDLGDPTLEVQSAVATRGADGAARVRVRCLVADGSPCELQASVAEDGPPVRWEVGGGPVELEAPLPERAPRDLRVSVRARDAQGNSTWAGADVRSPGWTADEPGDAR